MRRALVHAGGPKGAGKTTLVEAILNGVDGLFIVARCFRDSSLKRVREDAGIACPELRRYRDAGACDAARFTFPNGCDAHDAFFESDLMGDYSEAAILEGDNPLEFVDLDIFVAPPLPPGKTLLVRRRRDRTREAQEKLDHLERMVGGPEGTAEFLEQIGGTSLAEFARKHPGKQERIRLDLLAGIARLREVPPPKATDHWVVAETYHGIERAQLVVVNVRDASEREQGEALIEEVGRLRTDPEVFADIIGFRGNRTPVTAVVANLLDGKDPGTKKAVARVRRALRARS